MGKGQIQTFGSTQIQRIARMVSRSADATVTESLVCCVVRGLIPSIYNGRDTVVLQS